MPVEPVFLNPHLLDPSVLELLACPACLGKLRVDASSPGPTRRLVCAACGRGYPIVEGIPVLIAERV